MSTDQKRLRIQVRDVLAAAGSRAPGPGARFDELEVLKANALTWAHYVDANEADHDAADKYKALLELARIAQNVWAQVGWAK